MSVAQVQHIGWTDLQRRETAQQVNAGVDRALSSLGVVPGESHWLEKVSLLVASGIEVRLCVRSEVLGAEAQEAIAEVFRVASRWSDTRVVLEPAGNREVIDTLDLRGKAFATREGRDQE